MSYKWVSDSQIYKIKLKSKQFLKREEVKTHPLENSIKKSSSIITPLDLDSPSLEELDPLTKMAVDDLNNSSYGKIRKTQDTFEPWSSKKTAILNKFTTQEKLSITTSSFASSADGAFGVSEKVLQRVQQLDLDCGSRQFFGGLTQEEYMNKINQLDQQMISAWQSDLRVNALKISIQSCKLLGDTTVLYFYPTKFVIVTDILDKFGDMVYNRLKEKQSDTLTPEVAKETGKNWFFKVGSIRELLPRVSIELAILKSFSFISTNPDYGHTFMRLLNCMWGIGDPVVSIYLRCYLCRKAMELIPNDKELYLKSFQDLLMLHDKVLDNFRTNPQFYESKVTMEVYMNVLSPAVEYILQCCVHRGNHLNYIIQLISNVPSFWKSVLLNSVFMTFPPNFINEECLNILDMMTEIETNIGLIIKNLGTCLILTDSKHHEAKEIWTIVSSFIKKLNLKEQYLDCSQVWVEFLVKNFGNDMINAFLEDLLSQVSFRELENKGNQGKLKVIIEKLITYSNDIVSLFHNACFIKLVTLLKSNIEVVKSVLSSFNSKHSGKIEDNILINTLMHLSSIIHDSVDALTPVDEIKQIGNLISGIVIKVSYGKEYEKQLQFYDEARGTFSNIDLVLVHLIHCVCKLAMDVKNLVTSGKRIKSFHSACIAYCFITIPSLESHYSQLQLYLLTSQVAYSNHCVSQGDACLKAAMNLMHENVSDMDCGEALLFEYVSNLMSTLLIVPDHPKEPTLYMLKALMTIEWNSILTPIRFLVLLNSYAQEKFPYSFNGVEANDRLYGNDSKYLSEIDTLSTNILNNILTTLKALGEQDQIKKQARLSMELFWVIVVWGDISKMGNLSLNLWNLSRKSGMENKLVNKTIQSVRQRSKFKREFEFLAARLT